MKTILLSILLVSSMLMINSCSKSIPSNKPLNDSSYSQLIIGNWIPESETAKTISISNPSEYDTAAFSVPFGGGYNNLSPAPYLNFSSSGVMHSLIYVEVPLYTGLSDVQIRDTSGYSINGNNLVSKNGLSVIDNPAKLDTFTIETLTDTSLSLYIKYTNINSYSNILDTVTEQFWYTFTK
jgi:hypothetical protein